MRRLLVVGMLAALLCAVVMAEPAQKQDVSKSTGAVTGTLSIWKTKVKTKGPKSSKDIVVYLKKEGENHFPAPKDHASMDQQGLIFTPHVLAIQKGTTVDFLNNDNDKHNVYILRDSSGETMDLGTWNPKEQRSHTFTEPDEIIALCKLHLEMAAYILVLDSPYFTTAEIDGESQKASYVIENVPPGQYVLGAWHKKLKVKGGEVKITIEADKTAKADMIITKSKYAE